MSNALPEQFKELERFVPVWALARETDRHRTRLSSSMEDLRTFYDAMLARSDEIFAFLNRFPLDRMPDDARRLFWLTLSLAEVSLAIEWWEDPNVPDGFEPFRWVPIHESRKGFLHSL